MIIGVCGFIGSGKDTLADYLVNVHEYRKESFANILKDCLSIVFGWDRVLLEGRTREAREWREQVDPWWANRLNMPNLTPRWIMQYWGTNVIRDHFHSDIWIAALENKMRHTTDNIVVSDCRFPNEISAIKSTGIGAVIRVVRGPEPEWYNDAVIVNAGPKHPEWAQARGRLAAHHVHDSECAWAGTDFDAVIDNNGSLDQMYQQINNLVLNLRPSIEDRAW